MPSRSSVSTHRLWSQFISGVIATVLTAGVVLAVTSRGPAEALTMPRSGVITVTGYEMISVMNPSSGAQSLVLTRVEAPGTGGRWCRRHQRRWHVPRELGDLLDLGRRDHGGASILDGG